jgi:tRNA A-37 threonylcarbamoyl transferase component Bud32
MSVNIRASTGRATEADRFGRYEILHKLASGGMGEVYLARSVGAAGFQKHVVIKKLLPHLVEQTQFVEGLIREAKILVRLDHPNIVQVLDLGMEGTGYFMAMEYVHGYNLATVIHYCAQNQLTIPVTACAAVALDVLAGLDYAHNLVGPDGAIQNIIHRDVSPQNVLISTEGRVKLLDFGIAKVLNEAEGEFTQSLKGKFRYMAPEVVEGGRIDQRYDLFAVGILLFESLCRRHLFSGNNDLDILSQVRKARVPPVARYHPSVSPEMVRVVEKALAKDPSRRYQTARDFSHALREGVRPVNEADASADLRIFVGELYGKRDFPINKPKLPDLSAPFAAEGTRSLNLQPIPMAVSRGGAGRRRAYLAIAFGVVLAGGMGAYLLHSHLTQSSAGNPPGDVNIRIDDAHHDASPPPRQPDLRAVPPDAAPAKPDRRGGPKPPPLPPAIAFNKDVGARTFAKHLPKLERCFTQHLKPTDPEVRVKVVSTINSQGKVVEAKLDPSREAGTPLGQCILRVVSRIRYPRHNKPSVTFLQPVRSQR